MHKALHANCVRQMSVLKDRDVGYKIALSNQDKKAIMSHSTKDSMLTFRLELYYSNGLPVIDITKL